MSTFTIIALILVGALVALSMILALAAVTLKHEVRDLRDKINNEYDIYRWLHIPGEGNEIVELFSFDGGATFYVMDPKHWGKIIGEAEELYPGLAYKAMSVDRLMHHAVLWRDVKRARHYAPPSDEQLSLMRSMGVTAKKK